jgi:hypothetical protein
MTGDGFGQTAVELTITKSQLLNFQESGKTTHRDTKNGKSVHIEVLSSEKFLHNRTVKVSIHPRF